VQTVRTIGIRGAGLAGLSVAQELLRSNPELSISVFDVRSRLPHPQRTFCFFQPHEGKHQGIPTFTWKTVMFRGSSFERRIDVSGAPYTMIRGDEFFSQTLQELEAGGVSFLFGCQEVFLDGNSLRVDGALRSFDCVIDAAFDPNHATSLMWQSFAGVWVNTPAQVFDPTTAILMDLQESSPEAPVSFLYVLPTSPHTALLEHTTFSQAPMAKEYHLERCFEWLRARVGDAFHIDEYERGAIPMGLQIPREKHDVVVGSNAGAVRPATGYAFLAAREHARRISQAILGNQDKEPHVYPRWLEKADALFLHALLRAPEKGSALMERLLTRSPSDALIAFLSGTVNLREALSVWLSVPKLTMIRSLLRV
jgi:lycopene beta-cyclase